MGIDTPLVDNEGYPRSDIDIYRARTLRKRYHEIQTDCKDLDRRMERGLVELTTLREAASSDDTSKSTANNKATKINEAEEIQARKAPKPKPKYDPITKQWVVKSWDGSIAGVKDGEIRKFEDLSHSTEGALASIAAGSGGQQRQNGSSDTQQSSSSTSSTSTTEEHRSTTTAAAPPPSTQQTTIPLTPFAIIDQVFANSPSQEAGILEGDLLLRFGTVTSSAHNSSFTSIKRAIVTELSMAHSNDCSISISVRRSTKMLGGVAEMIKVETFDLKPRVWNGQGLLGCHLQEYNE